VTITDTTVNTTHTHGLWSAALEQGTIENNTLEASTADLTFGGDRIFVSLAHNDASPAAETPNASAVEQTLAEPPDDALTEDLTELAIDCQLDVKCTTDVLANRFTTATSSSLNPLQNDYDSDADKLANCQGQGDDCLRDEFIHADDDTEPRTWTIEYPNTSDDWEVGQTLVYEEDFTNVNESAWDLDGAYVREVCRDPPKTPGSLQLSGFQESYNCILDGSTRRATLTSVDLPAASEIELSFTHDYREFYRAPLLYGADLTVSLQDENGTWHTLRDWKAGVVSENEWDQESLDLTPFAGQTVNLRFQLTHEDPYVDPPLLELPHEQGWFVDDLSVTAQDTSLPGGLEGAQLHFIDVAARAEGDDMAWRHHANESLDQEWTPLVLCRLEIGDAMQPCEALPRTFDQGLTVSWKDSDLPQRFSEWRLKLPTDEPIDAFDRVHGPDATLFITETEPHHEQATTGWEESDRVQHGGVLELACRISPASGTDPAATEDCNDPSIATEAIDPQPAWCKDARPDYDAEIHESMFREAETLWSWSQTCTTQENDTKTLDWPAFLHQDRPDLEAAHGAYANAETDEDRSAALADAERALERAAERHMAVAIEGHGLPTVLDEAELTNVTPRELDERLPASAEGSTAVWTGEEVLVFWPGERGQDPLPTQNGVVMRFDPSQNEATMGGAEFPGNYCCSAAAWTGEEVLLFGGIAKPGRATPATNAINDGESRLIQSYDPETDELSQIGTLPEPIVDAEAVWDPRPTEDCPEGCAFIFTNDGELLRYEPETGTTSTIETRRPTLMSSDASLTWTGQEALIFPPGDRVTIVNPHSTYPVERHWDSWVPEDTHDAAAVWDGSRAHVIGGTDDPYHNSIHVYDVEQEDWIAEWSLPHRTPDPIAVWAEEGAYAFKTQGVVYDDLIQNYTLPGDFRDGVNELHASGDNFDVVPLVAQPDATNIELERGFVHDSEHEDPIPVDEPGLIVDTPARLEFNLTYDAVSGDRYQQALALELGDRDPEIRAGPVNATYGSQTATDLHGLLDPDNRNDTRNLDDREARNTHTVPYLELTDNETGERVGHGLGKAGSDAVEAGDEITACVRELFTGRADGLETNLDLDTVGEEADRLAIDPTTECVNLGPLEPEQLAFRAPLVVTLQLRSGAEESVDLEMVHDPTKHPVHEDSPNENRTLADASEHHQPDVDEAAVEPASIRIVVTTNRTPTQNSLLLADLMQQTAGPVSIFSVEIDDLPAPHPLDRALEHAVVEKGATVLAGAGILPEDVRDWPREDKLMTVKGLAQHPRVITVGAGSEDEGVANWSRRGPSPSLLGPKPDVVAPSPVGSTVGAVQNVLPFAEALHARGLHSGELVRVVLAGYAVPIDADDGAPAVWWEQGAGAVDLTRFLEVPSTAELIEDFENETGTNNGAEELADILNVTDASTVEQAQPAQILGAAGNTTGVVRAGVSESLVNLTLDAPRYRPPASSTTASSTTSNPSEPRWTRSISTRSSTPPRTRPGPPYRRPATPGPSSTTPSRTSPSCSATSPRPARRSPSTSPTTGSRTRSRRTSSTRASTTRSTSSSTTPICPRTRPRGTCWAAWTPGSWRTTTSSPSNEAPWSCPSPWTASARWPRSRGPSPSPIAPDASSTAYSSSWLTRRRHPRPPASTTSSRT
jgi:hypothetical protein